MSVPEVAPYTAEEREALGREHAPSRLLFSLVCFPCNTTWPCPTARLLATVAEQDERIRQDNVFCICGCPDSEHESYGEDGGACENEHHECIRVCAAAASISNTLRATVEAKDAEIAAIVRDRDFWRDGEKQRFADLRAVAAEKESLREQLRQQVEEKGNLAIELNVERQENAELQAAAHEQLRQQTERAEKAERGMRQLQEVLGPLQSAKSSLDDLIPYAESLKQEVAVLRAGHLTVAPVSANDEGAQDAVARLEAENTALKAQVEKEQTVVYNLQCDNSRLRRERDGKVVESVSLRSTIEAQAQEIERLKHDENCRPFDFQRLKKAEEGFLEATHVAQMFAGDAQSLTAQNASKDAILRECANFLYDEASSGAERPNRFDDLAAKCEAALGTGEGK